MLSVSKNFFICYFCSLVTTNKKNHFFRSIIRPVYSAHWETGNNRPLSYYKRKEQKNIFKEKISQNLSVSHFSLINSAKGNKIVYIYFYQNKEIIL